MTEVRLMEIKIPDITAGSRTFLPRMCPRVMRMAKLSVFLPLQFSVLHVREDLFARYFSGN